MTEVTGSAICLIQLPFYDTDRDHFLTPFIDSSSCLLYHYGFFLFLAVRHPAINIESSGSVSESIVRTRIATAATLYSSLGTYTSPNPKTPKNPKNGQNGQKPQNGQNGGQKKGSKMVKNDVFGLGMDSPRDLFLRFYMSL